MTLAIRWILLLLVLAGATAAQAARGQLALRHSALELPGPPSRIVAADLDGDGRRDLAVVVAYTHWQELGFTDQVAMDDVAGLVETLTVVPALFDQRELHVFLADPATPGLFRPLSAPLPLDTSLHALEAGPTGLPLIAITDEGLATLELAGEPGAQTPRLAPLFAGRSVLAGTGNFVGRLELVADLDGDGRTDLLFPGEEGLEIFLNPASGLAKERSQLLRPATDERRRRGGDWLRRYPLPQVRDVDGDRLPDLLFPGHNARFRDFRVMRGLGGGRFEEQGRRFETPEPAEGAKLEEPIHFGDLDGDGRAEWVTREDLADDDAGVRKELEQARQPPNRYRFYRSEADLGRAAKPYFEMEAVGYTVESGRDDDGDQDGFFIPGGFQDLDGDGRPDLLAVTLDFSMLQAVRVLTVKSISIGLDFRVFCQNGQGAFAPVAGLDLSGKFRLDLENLKMGNLSLFSGDFDGDGRADFVQLGRGRAMTVHRGQPGCRFPAQPDLTLQLVEEPRDLALVRIEDLDADGASDLWVLQPGKSPEPGVSPKVRLDLYLSAAGSRP